MKIRCDSVKDRLIETENWLKSNIASEHKCILENQKTILSMLSGSFSMSAFDFDTEKKKDTAWFGYGAWEEIKE